LEDCIGTATVGSREEITAPNIRELKLCQQLRDMKETTSGIIHIGNGWCCLGMFEMVPKIKKTFSAKKNKFTRPLIDLVHL